MKTHGHSRGSPEYRAWSALQQRCSNPNDIKYRIYGARGIRVCDRWSSFENFLADMGPRPDGMSIDRYPDKDGNYEPGNCRWASLIDQNNNKNTNHLVLVYGVCMTMAMAARHYEVDYKLFRTRISRGWSPEDAINTPASTKEGLGVTFVRRRNRWRAEIKINGKSRHIGSFTKKEEAIEAFQEAAVRLRGAP
jgi:hypothetical protein